MKPGIDPSRPDIETRWLGDSARLAWRETRSFASAVAAITLRPARFARSWVRGEQQVMNPLGFFATSAAIVAVYQKVSFAVASRDAGGSGLIGDIANAVGPYLYYVVLGLLCHLMLRGRGSQRTVRGSLAVSLYVGGGPAAIVTIVNLTLFALAAVAFGRSEFTVAELASPAILALAIVVFASRIAVLVIFARALSGFHAVATGWTILALVLAIVATGLFFGLVDPPGSYGGHFVIGRLQEDSTRGWWPAYAF